MAGLSVWELGLIHLAALALAFAGRLAAVNLIIQNTPPLKRSIKQFQVDFILLCAAGMVVCLYNLAAYGFSFVHSGLKVVLGFSTVGLFAAIDLALERERRLDRGDGGARPGMTPPDELYPLTRKFTMVSIMVVALVTTIMVLIFERDLAWFSQEISQTQALAELKQAILFEVLFVMGVLLILVVNLVYSYSRNLKLLFHNQTDALEKVSQGELNIQVPVITNDEFGFIAGHTNSMIEGLKDRMRLLEGVKVAQEVQQNLLPNKAPALQGFDIAAKSLYSDETGGDYLDFIKVHSANGGGLGVVVGDVTGHGVGAALLMASARGFLRQRAALAGSLADMVGDVNKQLSRDTGTSGRFMSLYFLVIQPDGQGLSWVNAGHDPGILHNPLDASFEDLKGEDLVLGVEAGWSFNQHHHAAMRPGEVLVLATDGIWEAHSQSGEMFGKKRLKQIIRDSSAKSAGGILTAILDQMRNFVGSGPMEDDATLVVIKAAV
jgi:sigma-B regulation protein RsbU (phosphoserine phosphatase)